MVGRSRKAKGKKTKEGEKKVKPITASSGKPRRVKVKVKLLEPSYRPWDSRKVLG